MKIFGINHPKWVVIQLLEHCNLRCRMCYEWGETGFYHKKKELAILEYKVIKKVITDCLPGKPYFGLFGGEPFLYPNIEDVMRLIKNGGCGLDIPTNGVLLKQYAEMIVDVQPDRLWISLDGPVEINDEQRGKGVFNKVIQGIDALYEIRESKNYKLPKIGITYIVTPFNYTFIEEFFLKSIDIRKIDHLSIEFQLFATEEQYRHYLKILANEFGVFSAPCAKAIVREPSDFAAMDFKVLADQIRKVRSVCDEYGIYFIAYPKTIELDNIVNFFSANWSKMIDKRQKCVFPWMYAEISANGDVSVCHTYYDLVIGNINVENILDIWEGDRLKKVRKFLKKQPYPICTACSRYYADPNKH